MGDTKNRHPTLISHTGAFRTAGGRLHRGAQNQTYTLSLAASSNARASRLYYVPSATTRSLK